MVGDERGIVLPFSASTKRPIRELFVPLTGNPENGDYLDWYKSTRQGEVTRFPQQESPQK